MRSRSAVVPLQNRVTPPGDLVATADRGLVHGNRGRLHGSATRCCDGRRPVLVEVMLTGRRGDVPFLDPSAQT